MRADISSGTAHADLSVEFSHHHGGSKMTKQDKVVASAEFVGTFFLALMICASKNNMDPSSHPFAIGLGLSSLIYALGPISGGQFNPAVTLGLWGRNKINTFEAAYCLVSQVAGALGAAVVCWALFGDDWTHVAAPSISNHTDQWPAFVAEYLQTLALVMTVLNTATTAVQANNSYFGLAIGFVVVSGALTVGSVSGGCFNPAIAMISLVQGRYADAFIYLLAQFVAALTAAGLFRVMNPAEWDDSDPIARLTHSHHNPDGSNIRAIAMASSELFGTMMLAYTIGLSGNADGSGYFAVGTILAAMIYMGGSVSGAHFNPAVSIGVYLKSRATNGSMRAMDCCMYIVVQIGGAFLGGKLAHIVNGGDISGPFVNSESGRNDTDAMLAETLFTFMLMMVVLCVACSSKVAGNSYYGIAIGFAVLAGASSVGDVSGAALNPAVGIALSSIRGNTEDMFVYIVGPIIGAVLATYVFLYWYDEEIK
jgi:aquaporin Z